MITIEADFNRLNHGRLVLSRLAVHEHTPFADLAATGDRILFVHGEDIVEGKLVEDPSDLIDRCMTFHRVGMTTAYASPLEASRLPSEVTAR